MPRSRTQALATSAGGNVFISSARGLQTVSSEVCMAKYGKSASKNVESTMRRRKKGTLKSGSGRKVTSRKQAIAIGLSEAREKGAKGAASEVLTQELPEDVSRSSDEEEIADGHTSRHFHPIRRRGTGSHRAGGRAAGVRPCQTELARRRGGERRPRQAQSALEKVPARQARIRTTNTTSASSRWTPSTSPCPIRCTPSTPFARREAGVHVLCEKPMAVTVEECQRMIDACDENGVKLMIAYRLHFEEINLKAVDLVRRGRIGDPKFFNSSFAMTVRRGDIRTQEGHGRWHAVRHRRVLHQCRSLSVSSRAQGGHGDLGQQRHREARTRSTNRPARFCDSTENASPRS